MEQTPTRVYISAEQHSG